MSMPIAWRPRAKASTSVRPSTNMVVKHQVTWLSEYLDGGIGRMTG